MTPKGVIKAPYIGSYTSKGKLHNGVKGMRINSP